jgi:hypothetical protein
MRTGAEYREALRDGRKVSYAATIFEAAATSDDVISGAPSVIRVSPAFGQPGDPPIVFVHGNGW